MVGLFTSTLRLLTCPCTFWQGDNKGEAEAEDEERGRKKKDGEEKEQDGEKVDGKEGQGFSRKANTAVTMLISRWDVLSRRNW